MSDARRLTRRDALTGAAAAGAGVLLGPAAARAAAQPGDSPVFAVHVGELAAGAARTVPAPRAFCLAAVAWSGPGHARIELRSRRADGRWGRWVVASSCGHEGDGVHPRGHVGEGVWTGAAHELQLRARAPVHGVLLHLVAVGSGASHPPADDQATDGARATPAGALPLAGPSLTAGPGQPPIIARQAWAGADHPPVHGPYYGAIEMGIVHHTENANGYAPGDVPAMLRAIYEFHVHGRGWFDIGYNFVVDRFGRIWEARQGGIDLPVMGAQAGDWNQISFGVSMLGTYTDVLPSAAALDAVQRLLAWKMALNGLPVIGDISEVVAAEGVSWTQFRAGQHVRFPRIAGHREVDATTCPGDALYGHLPVMRPRIRALTGSPPTLSLNGELTFLEDGPTLTLTARLVAHGGAAIAGAPVALQAVVGRFGHTRTLASGTTDASGAVTATVTPHAGELVRAIHAVAPAVVSPLLAVQRFGSGGLVGVETLRLARPASS